MPFNPEDYKKYEHYIVSEIEEGFIHVQFNNPKVYNAFSQKDWQDYRDILIKIDRQPETNVILISSAFPKAFTSGLNMKAAAGLFASDDTDPDEKTRDIKVFVTEFQECIGMPATINTPTIALLNGINFGLALDIAAACTIRVATADAKFSIKEIKIGIAADIGSLQRLPAITNNKSLLFQHALLGDDFSAEEALSLGLVSKVVPDIRAGIEYCTEIGQSINKNIQWAIKGTKKHIQDIIDGKSVEEGLRDVANYNATNIGGGLILSSRPVKL
ncbi:enoyl CoA hydratase [Scheffersomyces xylosifermentans]|uniref:enoyl CoA hydratase n=1 Tax=Scheffersomyces xylosifermentans TaxID=1304137 RepID=UPI00315CB688